MIGHVQRLQIAHHSVVQCSEHACLNVCCSGRNACCKHCPWCAREACGNGRELVLRAQWPEQHIGCRFRTNVVCAEVCTRWCVWNLLQQRSAPTDGHCKTVDNSYRGTEETVSEPVKGKSRIHFKVLNSMHGKRRNQSCSPPQGTMQYTS